MFKEFDEIVAVSDPVDAVRRLDELDAKLERMARGYAELDRASESLRISESDPSGAITVTVDAHGHLLEVGTTPAVARLAPERLGRCILACVRRAQARIAGRIEELARQTVGADEMAVHVVNTMRERFPEPEPDIQAPQAAAGPGVMDFGGDELYDDEPPAARRRAGSRDLGGRRHA